ncbi:hypothetical protein ACFT30_05485 [Microbacterium ureisolvens]|uniref:hypothetical protein n=1 Tax=Microbacterium ureisolvens TaxID=2781186 RepID=UPI003638B18C
MSSAEPFMPAHEPPAHLPPQEHDIDHDTDVLFDAESPGAPETDPEPWHSGDAPATLPRPVPGEHLTAEQLSADLGTDEAE